ncbi:Flp family type IVb pilin [Achromobacter aegrifaciens]|uniref:Flp family type IVb pilin n=1 Tax=Achromobacter aegrifaciens TaxID=1287736 RepID=A0ABU2D9U1_ACHAE|nr:Flp family type IVb pilin [Achromobacter aegrifaciens]MDR7944812.1 Flp family type IVb pilin [Achromobacter aegrifaciens]
MKATLAQFWNDEDGITALEYGLIAGMVAVALIVAVGAFTGALQSMFSDLGTKLDTARTTPPAE